jgi:hypothetical protein
LHALLGDGYFLGRDVEIIRDVRFLKEEEEGLGIGDQVEKWLGGGGFVGAKLC